MLEKKPKRRKGTKGDEKKLVQPLGSGEREEKNHILICNFMQEIMRL